MTNTIEFRDPADLAIHPAAKKLAAWDKDDNRFIALVEDIRERGIDQPLQVDPENRILDGRERWKAAKQLQLKSVPVIVRDPGEALAVILAGLVARKHYTKGALAYVAFPLFEPVRLESRKRVMENLKKGEKANVSPRVHSMHSRETAEDFAESQGFDRRILFQAGELHRLFTVSDQDLKDWEEANPDGGEGRPEDLRGQFEPKILSGEIGLGAAIAGIAGKNATNGKTRPESDQLELFAVEFRPLKGAYKFWQNLGESEMPAAQKIIDKTVAEMPANLRLAFAKAISKAARREEES